MELRKLIGRNHPKVRTTLGENLPFICEEGSTQKQVVGFAWGGWNMVPKICIPNVGKKWVDKTFWGSKSIKKSPKKTNTNLKIQGFHSFLWWFPMKKWWFPWWCCDPTVATYSLQPSNGCYVATFQAGGGQSAPAPWKGGGFFFSNVFFFFEREKEMVNGFIGEDSSILGTWIVLVKWLAINWMMIPNLYISLYGGFLKW